MVINDYQLDSLYFCFFIWMFFYYWIFGQFEMALFYVKEVICIVQQFEQIEFFGNGYMLIVMFLKDEFFEILVWYYLKVVEIFESFGNYIGYFVMFCNLVVLYKDY